MRWSRHHTDTSLGELMDASPATTDPGSDVDTRVRPGATDHAADPASGEPVEASGSSDSFLDDEDYLPQERLGPSRLTVALVAALVLAVGVLGGVWVQKQLGSSAGGSSAGGASGQGLPGGAAGGQGFPGGGTGGQGFPSGGTGGQGAPGGAASGEASTQPGAGSGAGAGSETGSGTGGRTSTTPVVVGTVSSSGSKSLVVTDLGGTRHTVTVTKTTTVTTPYGHGALKSGDTVAVAGSTASDGAVTATGVTVS